MLVELLAVLLFVEVVNIFVVRFRLKTYMIRKGPIMLPRFPQARIVASTPSEFAIHTNIPLSRFRPTQTTPE